MFCTNCGKQLDDDAKFCPSCGHVVDEAERGAQEPETPQPAPETPPEPEAPTPEAPRVPGAPEEPLPEAAPPPSVGAAYQPTVPGAPTPAAEPTAAEPVAPEPTVPEPTPPSAATPQPPPAQPTQPPPAQQPPPPTQPPGVQPPAAEPKKGGGKCWIIGCGILAVVLILGAIGTWGTCRFVARKAQEVQEQLPDTIANQIEIREPGDEGDIIEGIGDLGDEMATGQVGGFDPSSVDAAMLPAFNGFMAALAEDDPDAMHQWMGSSFKQQWSPDNWEPAPHIVHLGFRLDDQTQVSDSRYDFVILETVRNTDDDTQGDLSWAITFSREGSSWYVTDFE